MTAQQKMHIDDREPVLSIMVKPRETIRYTLNHKNFSYSLYVGAIGGFASALITLYGTPYQYKYSLGEMVYSSFITGVLYYLMINLILAALLSAIGSVFKGKGNVKTLFQTLCLTSIPYIWLTPIILFWMQLAPQTFFEVKNIAWEMTDYLIVYVGSFFILAASIWVFVLNIIGVSEAHQISKWKSFFILLLASVISSIVLGIFMIFFM